MDFPASLLDRLGFLLLRLDLLLLVVFDLVEQLSEQIVRLLIIGIVSHHISELFFDLILSLLCFVGLNYLVFQSASKFILLFRAESGRVEGRHGLEVHKGLFELKLLVYQDFFPEGIAVQLFLIACGSVCELLCFFLLTTHNQLFRLVPVQLNLPLQLSLLVLEFLDLSSKCIDRGFNRNLFIFLSFSSRSSDYFRFLVLVAKEPVHEGHDCCVQ